MELCAISNQYFLDFRKRKISLKSIKNSTFQCKKRQIKSEHIHILQIDGSTVRVYNSNRIPWHERNIAK